MFYKKSGYPDNGEIVMCTVKKILPNSVFAYLDEYKDREGFIHISEVSPGRIRNLRDFVRIGKKIVCKVLKVDRERGQIDLSLRRVSISVKRNKLDELKQEERAEKILGLIGKKLDKNLEIMYKEVGENIISKYGSLMKFFQAIVIENLDAKKELNLNDKLSKVLISVVKDKIKPPEINLISKLVMKDYSSEGVENIKKILNAIKEFGKKNEYDLEITYLGAPNYRLKIKASNFKDAEKILKKISEKYESLLDKSPSEGELIKA